MPKYPRHIEPALVEISHLLVSSFHADIKHILSILGNALKTYCVYVVELPYDDAVLAELDEEDVNTVITVWHPKGELAEADWRKEKMSGSGPVLSLLIHENLQTRRPQKDFPGFAVPLLSPEDKLFGYLGMERLADPHQATLEERESLRLLGDLFVSYFTRKSAEQSLRESEARWQKLVDLQPQSILISDAHGIIYVNAACKKLLGAAQEEDILGRSVLDFVSAEFHDEIEGRQKTVDGGEASNMLEHEIIRLDGQERIVESISMPLFYSGRRAIYTALYDITERKEREQGYRTFVETISEAVWRIDIAEPLATNTSLETQVEHLLAHGYLAEYNSVMARLLHAENSTSLIELKLHELLALADPSVLSDFLQNDYQLQNREFSAARKNQDPRHFVVNAAGMIDRGYLKRIWGSCIDITGRVELERRTVTMMEEQQERIGRDLHDSVGQLLTGIRILSTNLATRHFKEGHAGFDLAHKVVRFAEEASGAIRDIYRGLAPPQLYQEGLIISLESLAANIDLLPEVTCIYEYNENAEVLAREPKIQLYRIAQEATNNALKYAKAKNIWVSLQRTGPQIVLQVRDDGIGFNKDGQESKSMGLYSMEHRAHSIRAKLSIDSTPGQGTTIKCTYPVSRRD